MNFAQESNPDSEDAIDTMQLRSIHDAYRIIEIPIALAQEATRTCGTTVRSDFHNLATANKSGRGSSLTCIRISEWSTGATCQRTAGKPHAAHPDFLNWTQIILADWNSSVVHNHADCIRVRIL